MKKKLQKREDMMSKSLPELYGGPNVWNQPDVSGKGEIDQSYSDK